MRSRLLGRITQEYGPELRVVVGNTGWLVFDRILRMGVGLLVWVWVARYLGPERFGLLSYALAFVALFNIAATLGLDSIVVRDVVRDPAGAKTTLGTAFASRLTSGVIMTTLAVSSVWLLSPDYATRALISILALGMILQAFDVIDLWFQSQVQAKFIVLAKNTAFIIAAALKITLIYTGAPLVAFAWATLAELFLGALGLVLVYRWRGQLLRTWRFNFRRVWILLIESWPLILSGFAIMVYMRIDQIMLRELVGARAVGTYSAATRISEAWYFVPTLVVSSVYPSIIRSREISEELYYRRLKQLFSFLAAIALCIIVPFTLLSNPMVIFLFGERYAASAPVLTIHIWAAIFVFFGVAQTAWYVNEGFTRLAFLRTLVGMVVNVSLNLLLIPLYSGIGAAVATVIAQSFAAVFSNAFHIKTRRIFLLQLQSLNFLSYFFKRG